MLLNRGGEAVCREWVELGGLGSLFSSLMRGHLKAKGYSEKDDEEHSLSALFALLWNLQSSPALLDRVLAKFKEVHFEKLDKLLEIYLKYERRVAEMNQYEDDDEDEIYLERMEAGLFTLQLAALILIFLAHSDATVSE